MTLSPSADKGHWRAWAREQWRRVDPGPLSGRVVEHLRAWDEVQSARCVLVYLPMGSEIDLTGLVDDLAGRAAATRTPQEGPLTAHRLEGALETHRLGFRQPTADAAPVPPAIIDVALVPGLAFDRRGGRLGHGAGYYDEFLSRLSPHTHRVGVVPSALVVDRLPQAPYDIPMTRLVTEHGLSVVPSP